MDTGNSERVVPTVSNGRWMDRCRAEMPDVIGHLIFWPILLAGLLVDLWTKQTVFAWLCNKPTQSAEIIDGLLVFRMALNPGAAFGIFEQRSVFLAGVSILALILILGVFFFSGVRQRTVQVALGLFAAGVSGNLWDRLFNDGLVRDFIDVVYWPGRHWHTFNVADALLCIAVALLIVATFFTDLSDRKHAPPRK